MLESFAICGDGDQYVLSKGFPVDQFDTGI
jgi:hypothetical protein